VSLPRHVSRHLTIGQTLSVTRSGGMVQVLPLHQAMLDCGLPSRLIYVDSPDGASPPAESVALGSLGASRFFFDWRTASRIERAVEQADVVHVHGMYTYLNYVAGRCCRRHGKALIYHPHGALAPAFRSQGRIKKGIALWAFERRNSKRVAAYRALTPAEAQHIHAFEPSARVLVVPNGVHLPELSVELPEKPAELGIQSASGLRVFLFLARLSASKGLDLLLDAFRALSQRQPDWALWIAGVDRDGTEARLRSELERSPIPRVSILGSVSSREKDWLLRAADVFVLPSRGEGQSPAVLEAMAYALPVLLTTTCFYPDAQKFDAGRECAPTALELFDAMLSFTRLGPGERAAMGRRGRELVTRRHDFRDLALALHEQVESLRVSPLES